MRVQHAASYDELIENLPIDPDEIIAFKLPAKLQQRVAKLFQRNGAGKLSYDEELELQRFLAMEATMRALKAKALSKKSKKS